MRRFLVFLFILGVALAGLYVWWQRNATRILTEQVRVLSADFFRNPHNLSVTNDPVKMIGLREARVPKLVISGKDLDLKNGLHLAAVRLVLRDVDVAGPPFGLSKVAAGDYTVVVTDDAVMDYLHRRAVSLLAGVVRIPLDSVTITFTKQSGTQLAAAMPLPFGKPLPVTATGKLVASSKAGQVDFRVNPNGVKIASAPIPLTQIADALEKINPVVDVSKWPIVSEVTPVTGDGIVTLRGKVTGAAGRSLLP